MVKKLFTKSFKKAVLNYGKTYYSANKQKDVTNPDFEKCNEDGFERLRCNTCEFKETCGRGEDYFEDNPNIIEELVGEIINCIEKREEKIGVVK